MNNLKTAHSSSKIQRDSMKHKAQTKFNYNLYLGFVYIFDIIEGENAIREKSQFVMLITYTTNYIIITVIYTCRNLLLFVTSYIARYLKPTTRDICRKFYFCHCNIPIFLFFKIIDSGL